MIESIHKSCDGQQGWAVWKIEERECDFLTMLPVNGIYVKELETYQAIAKRRMERLAVRVLMYTCWGVEYEVCYHVSGKPYLANGLYFISISHTQGYVALVWSGHRRVSIDIESVSPKALKLRQRFMHPDEHGEGDSLLESLLHWSAKESLYKILPMQEQVDFANHLRVFPFTIQEQGYMVAHDRRNPTVRYDLFYQVDANYVMTCIGVPNILS